MPGIRLGHKTDSDGQMLGDMKLLTRSDHDRYMGMRLTDPCRQRGSIDRARHGDIREDRANFGMSIQREQRFIGAVRLDHHISRILENELNVHQQKQLIFDD